MRKWKLEIGKWRIGNRSLRGRRFKQVCVKLVWYTRRVSMANLQRGALMRGLQMSMPLAKAASRTTRPALFAAAALAMLLGISRTAHAQAPTPKRTIVRAGRVLDVRTGQMRSNQAIVIEGEKIAQVVASSEVKAAAGDTTIDLPDATLLPGLIDAHTHLTLDLSSLGYQGLAISTAREALHGERN